MIKFLYFIHLCGLKRKSHTNANLWFSVLCLLVLRANILTWKFKMWLEMMLLWGMQGGQSGYMKMPII